MDLGLHLPLIPLGPEPLGPGRMGRAVDAARECGLAALAANDHLVFRTPWLDGPTALASAIERSGGMTLATTVALPSLRGPAPLAKALAAIDVLSGGRVVAGLGPGSSRADHEVVGIPFDRRAARFEEAVVALRSHLRRLEPPPVREGGIPLWIASWGGPAGLVRVARLGDGWLASAYNTTPEAFAASLAALPAGLPAAVATMWTWVCDGRAERERALADVLAPVLDRDPADLAPRVCVGPPEHCAELLARYARAGCRRVHLWPLGDEPGQVERVVRDVLPLVEAAGA
ncbi:MAG: LLM class flavin-dependent oxidoreductase [Thermoleophilia bacterium]